MKIMMIKTTITFVLMILSYSAFSDQTLNATEIKTLFSDKTVTAYSEIAKVNVSLFYDNNGEVRGIFTNGKIGKTLWWVKDSGQICLKSKKGDLCFEVVEKNDGYQKYLIKADGTRILAFSTEIFSNGNNNQY
jgi:hypothetical protein